MKRSTILGLASASVAMAQMTPGTETIGPEQIAVYALGLLSPSCQSTVIQLTNASSPLFSCLHFDALLPAILTNGSVVPPVDSYLSTICASDPCSTATLNMTAQMIIQGCASDLVSIGADNETITDLIDFYPWAREIACLKTTSPIAPANASIPINSTAYNSTNGTFCITEILTDLSGYLGANLTNAYLDTTVLGGNSTALQLLQNIPLTAICNECIFAAIDLTEVEYPSIGNYSVGENYTINSFLEGTCPGYQVWSNGTLPMNITIAAENSTFPEVVIGDNATYTPNSDAVAAPTLNSPVETEVGLNSIFGTPAPVATAAPSGSMAEKRRWIGAQ